MKRTICILFSLLFTFTMIAQPQQRQHEFGGGKRQAFSPEAYEKKLEEHITQRAGLTPEEAAKFFPLFKEMNNEKRAISEKQRKMQKPFKEPFKGPSEEDCKKMVTDEINLELQHRKIEQTYYTKKFPTVLSWKKIIRVRWAMESFKMEALRHFAPHPGPGGQFPGRNGQNNRPNDNNRK